MDGILVIDKPAGITSHDVVARVRRILKTKRVGHTGTLDPFATGVLVLMIGKATRLAQFLDKDQKEYEAAIQFGFETDTGDRTGSPTADHGLRYQEIADLLTKTDWKEVFAAFRGEIEQTPPMYSAKKVNGKKLYELARKGEEIERKPIKIEIFDLERLRDDRFDLSSVRIRVVCSAGTYIRTLAEDIGRRIGIGAHLTELRRTRAGKFTIDESLDIQELERLGDTASVLHPITAAVDHLPALALSDDRVAKTRSGLPTRPGENQFADGQAVQMLDRHHELIAVGFYSEADKTVRPKIVLV